MTRADLEQEFVSYATTLTDDELRVLNHQARRMTRIGHSKYGGLDLAKEDRDWTQEMAAESSDRLFYESCREVARAVRNQEERTARSPRVQAFIDAQFDFSDEPTGEWVKAEEEP